MLFGVKEHIKCNTFFIILHSAAHYRNSGHSLNEAKVLVFCPWKEVTFEAWHLANDVQGKAITLQIKKIKKKIK